MYIYVCICIYIYIYMYMYKCVCMYTALVWHADRGGKAVTRTRTRTCPGLACRPRSTCMSGALEDFRAVPACPVPACSESWRTSAQYMHVRSLQGFPCSTHMSGALEDFRAVPACPEPWSICITLYTECKYIHIYIHIYIYIYICICITVYVCILPWFGMPTTCSHT